VEREAVPPKQESMFFFEKKNQKTFPRLLASAPMGANG
jgi:hypothetical protein